MMVGKAILVYGIGPVWHCTCAHVIVHLLALYLHGVARVALHVCARHCALTGTVLAWRCTCAPFHKQAAWQFGVVAWQLCG